MSYVKFDELIEYVNGISEQKISLITHAIYHTGIRNVGKMFPISVNESEFNFMHDTIVKYNLRNGFELSTGTGISTIGLGRAFATTSGSLISMDSYYEEATQLLATTTHETYTDEEKDKIKSESKCYKFVNDIVTKESLPVKLAVGWSPEDVIKALTDKSIDFVFLDCPKSDDEFQRDINAIHPFINKEKFFIFIHDSHTFTPKSFELVKSLFNLEIKLIHSYYENTIYAKNWHYPLGMITNQS